jgi:hypothetical protein
MTTPVLVETDTAPTLSAVLTNDSTSAPLDLSSADSVFFQLRLESERRFKVNGECDITDATAGEVEYALGENDLDFVGSCLARFLVVWGDGRRQHTTPAISIEVQSQ